jgi:hypothetical protein
VVFDCGLYPRLSRVRPGFDSPPESHAGVLAARNWMVKIIYPKPIGPIKEQHRSYLRISYSGQPFQMRCLSFGLVAALKPLASLTNWMAELIFLRIRSTFTAREGYQSQTLSLHKSGGRQLVPQAGATPLRVSQLRNLHHPPGKVALPSFAASQQQAPTRSSLCVLTTRRGNTRVGMMTARYRTFISHTSTDTTSQFQSPPTHWTSNGQR